MKKVTVGPVGTTVAGEANRKLPPGPQWNDDGTVSYEVNHPTRFTVKNLMSSIAKHCKECNGTHQFVGSNDCVDPTCDLWWARPGTGPGRGQKRQTSEAQRKKLAERLKNGIKNAHGGGEEAPQNRTKPSTP